MHETLVAVRQRSSLVVHPGEGRGDQPRQEGTGEVEGRRAITSEVNSASSASRDAEAPALEVVTEDDTIGLRRAVNKSIDVQAGI